MTNKQLYDDAYYAAYNAYIACACRARSQALTKHICNYGARIAIVVGALVIVTSSVFTA